MDVYHIVPVNDLKEHKSEENDLGTCDCKPVVTVIENTGDLMVTHNSCDGREHWERLREPENICGN